MQERFPGASIIVRLDGGFAEPELFEFLDCVCVDYVVAMAKNKELECEAEFDLLVAPVLSEAPGKTEHVYTEFAYAAGTWSRERRVV